MVKLVTSSLIMLAMNAITEETIVMEGLQQEDNMAMQQPAVSEELKWPMEVAAEVPEENLVELQETMDVQGHAKGYSEEELAEEDSEEDVNGM
jgi:hypothetical protein